MPELITVLAAAAAGLAAGVVLRIRLARLSFRLPDEVALPPPSSWWVAPVTALVTVLVWWSVGPSNPVVVPVVYTLAVWAMVALAFIDLDVQRLPDAIQLPAYPVLALLLAACAWATADWGAFVRALLAGLILWLLYLVLAVVPGGGIGFGDVKLAGLLGMLLGWLSCAHVMVGTMATFLIGGVVALGVLVLAKKGRRDEFAYGPSMLLGAVCALAAPLVLPAIA